METLKTIQAIIELAQKRPIVSFLCLAFLLVFVFAPLILTVSPTTHRESVTANQSEIREVESKPQPQTTDTPYTTRNRAPEPEPANYSPAILPAPAPQELNSNTGYPSSTIDTLFSKDRYFIVVASRADRHSATEVAHAYSDRFSTEIYETPNGWYAITIGHYPLMEAKRVLVEETNAQTIPANAWLSTGLTPGKEWLGKVFP